MKKLVTRTQARLKGNNSSRGVSSQKVMDTKETLDLDKFKLMMEKFELADMQPTVYAFLNIFENLGHFIIGIAEIQKKSNDLYEFMLKTKDNPQPFLSLIVEKMPSDFLKDALSAILEISALQPEFSQFEKLTPDRKIELGRRFVEISTRLRNRMKELENASIRRH